MKMLSHHFIQCILVTGFGVLIISNAIAHSLDTDKQIALRLQILTTGEKFSIGTGKQIITTSSKRLPIFATGRGHLTSSQASPLP